MPPGRRRSCHSPTSSRELCTCERTSVKQQRVSRGKKRIRSRSLDLLCCRPKTRLAEHRRGLLRPLMRPKVAHWIGAQRRAPLRLRRLAGCLHRLVSRRWSLVAFGLETVMVSVSEVIVVVYADTADQVRFLFLFFPYEAWVTAWEAGIFPAVCRVRRGAVTLDGALRDVAEASLSLPTVESKTYLSMGEPALPARLPHRRPSSCAGPRRAVVPGTSRCSRNAEKQDAEIQSEPTPKTYTCTDLTWIKIKVDDSRIRGAVQPSAFGHSLLRICMPKMFFARAIISALETLRCVTRVGLDYPQYSKVG
jgi:hypothetical protein